MKLEKLTNTIGKDKTRMNTLNALIAFLMIF